MMHLNQCTFNPMKTFMNILHMNMEKQPPGVFYKKVLLTVSQNSWENAKTRFSFLIKLQSSFLNKIDIPWLCINDKIHKFLYLYLIYIFVLLIMYITFILTEYFA